MPDEEEIERTARETAAALTLRVDKKQAAVNPKTLPQQPGAAQYIKVCVCVQGCLQGCTVAGKRSQRGCCSIRSRRQLGI